MEPLITRRAWLEVDLDQVAQNLAVIRRHLTPGCRFCAVVKADGYGQGAVMLARRLAREGVDCFAVATLDEGRALREAGIQAEILVLSPTDPALAFALLENGLTQAVGSPSYAACLSEQAQKAGGPLHCHIKLDTGMTRTGFDCRTSAELDAVAAAYALPGLRVTGTFSHFSSSDDPSDGAEEFSLEQIRRFSAALIGLAARGIDPGTRHLCNSGGIQKYPQAHFDMVRGGAILTGYPTACGVERWPGILPASSLKTAVTCLRQIEAGTCISYSRTFRAPGPMRVAVLAIGYADGYPRALSRRGRVILHGKWAPVLGNVCMDQMMVDVTGIPETKPGDIAVILGEDGPLSQTADDLGREANSCMHEILSRLGPRLQRLYFENGRRIAAQ
ncbi:MAG: alanine racemase [Oscillospiraceae bacterium]|nr:MAG: alanine racemase [Oscillospiraceae bacterium]